MSAIAPNTDLYLLKCPIEADNRNQITFANATAQYNYFNGLTKMTGTSFTYQRKDNLIFIPDHIDNIYNCNYVMYQNSNYSNKWLNNSISFMPEKNEQEAMVDGIKTKLKTTVAPSDNVEIRRLELENTGNDEQILEIVTYFEPVLSKKEQDYAHPAFNNLFLVYKYDEEADAIVVKRRNRERYGERLYCFK